MPKISEKEFERLANLAKLKFSEKEREILLHDLDEIILFCEKLNQIPTDNVEPMIYVNPETNVVRHDMVGDMIDKQTALQNAPAKDSDFFRISKVMKPKK
jgi:aspartyl-tRNA(Asn)/glutamyl-tRNA(Gln) amidotransferase subunit C